MGSTAFVLEPRAVDMLPVTVMFARRAAIYHHELCQAILRGMKAQMISDCTLRHGEASANIVMHDGDDEFYA